ncbi:MAG: carbamoyl-phosphate synthase, partial [candidate division WOR-3 bacterium]
MRHFDTGHPCIVLGMYETGLAVGRSLGRKGMKVIGVDWKRDIGFRSRYVKPFLCPHPLKDPKAFLEFMMGLRRSSSHKPVLFLTADEFVIAVSRMREQLADRYLFNIPSGELIECIMNKDCLYLKAQDAGIPVPKTVKLDTLEDLEKAR